MIKLKKLIRPAGIDENQWNVILIKQQEEIVKDIISSMVNEQISEKLIKEGKDKEKIKRYKDLIKAGKKDRAIFIFEYLIIEESL